MNLGEGGVNVTTVRKGHGCPGMAQGWTEGGPVGLLLSPVNIPPAPPRQQTTDRSEKLMFKTAPPTLSVLWCYVMNDPSRRLSPRLTCQRPPDGWAVFLAGRDIEIVEGRPRPAGDLAS